MSDCRLPKKLFFCFNEGFIKTMKNDFYFTLKALFVLNYFNFFLIFFGHLGKRIDKKTKVNFKTCSVIHWKTNNYQTQVTQAT